MVAKKKDFLFKYLKHTSNDQTEKILRGTILLGKSNSRKGPVTAVAVPLHPGVSSVFGEFLFI